MPREIRIILGLLLTSNACLNRFCVQVHKKKNKKKTQNNYAEYGAKFIQF